MISHALIFLFCYTYCFLHNQHLYCQCYHERMLTETIFHSQENWQKHAKNWSSSTVTATTIRWTYPPPETRACRSVSQRYHVFPQCFSLQFLEFGLTYGLPFFSDQIPKFLYKVKVFFSLANILTYTNIVRYIPWIYVLYQRKPLSSSFVRKEINTTSKNRSVYLFVSWSLNNKDKISASQIFSFVDDYTTAQQLNSTMQSFRLLSDIHVYIFS